MFVRKALYVKDPPEKEGIGIKGILLIGVFVFAFFWGGTLKMLREYPADAEHDDMYRAIQIVNVASELLAPLSAAILIGLSLYDLREASKYPKSNAKKL